MRTIFITVAVVNGFRNMCFFPGSVFFQLMDEVKKKPDLRIVFIFNGKDIEKYRWFFGPYEGPQCILRSVEFSDDRTLLQKVFRFFYAYLIYTPTTKVVSTIGMRADSPPGASSYYLGILKWIVSRTFGKSRFIKKRVVPYLHRRIFRERPFRKLFNEYDPSLVFSINMYGQFDQSLVREAKRRGVKTVGALANWDHVDKYFLPFQADILLVQNEGVKRAAIAYQEYSPKQIRLVGYPYFDFFQRTEVMLPREAVHARSGFPANAEYILYTSGSAYCPDEADVVEKILEWIDAGHFGPNMHLIVRPYVGGRDKDRALEERKFKKIFEHPRVFRYDSQNWDSIENSIFFLNIIRYSKVMMSVYSTIFLEAVMFDRPLVAAVFDGYKKRPYPQSIRRFEDFEHFQDFIKFGGLKRAFNFEELQKALTDYVKNPHLDAEKREKVRQEVVYITDGSSNKKITDILLAEVGTAKRHS